MILVYLNFCQMYFDSEVPSFWFSNVRWHLMTMGFDLADEVQVWRSTGVWQTTWTRWAQLWKFWKFCVAVSGAFFASRCGALGRWCTLWGQVPTELVFMVFGALWSEAVKLGRYTAGKKHGQGSFTWSDGSSYNGEDWMMWTIVCRTWHMTSVKVIPTGLANVGYIAIQLITVKEGTKDI